MLFGIHIILTYQCTNECDHCWFYCSPKSKGTFTVKQIKILLREAQKLGTEWIYFEGGEPFLFYPILLEGLKLAHDMGFKTGIATNSYWATSIEEAEEKLSPISKLNVSIFGISDDSYHSGMEYDMSGCAKIASIAAKNLGIEVLTLYVKEITSRDVNRNPRLVFKGRAVDNLTEGLPRRPWEELTKCPNRDLRVIPKVHIDSFGNVHICQGISIGNMWKTNLTDLIEDYDVNKHPICKPLLEGGPAQLARKYNIDHGGKYVNECHFCHYIRKTLIDRFPQYFTPRQVYGLG